MEHTYWHKLENSHLKIMTSNCFVCAVVAGNESWSMDLFAKKYSYKTAGVEQTKMRKDKELNQTGGKIHRLMLH